MKARVRARARVKARVRARIRAGGGVRGRVRVRGSSSRVAPSAIHREIEARCAWPCRARSPAGLRGRGR
eukprot:5699939-Prorocentrum_lima.AAC.1